MLRLHWGDAYHISAESGVFTARRRGTDDDGGLTAVTPDELTAKIRADWARDSAPTSGSTRCCCVPARSAATMS